MQHLRLKTKDLRNELCFIIEKYESPLYQLYIKKIRKRHLSLITTKSYVVQIQYISLKYKRLEKRTSLIIENYDSHFIAFII